MASPKPEHAARSTHDEPSPQRPAPAHQQDAQRSPKRKASEATGGGGGGGGSSSNSSGAHEANGDSSKKKRRKVNHACVYCRRSHMTCDLERPCARCIKRDIGHLCHDEPRDPPKRSKSDVGVAEIAPAPGDGTEVKSARNGQYAQSNGDVQMADEGGAAQAASGQQATAAPAPAPSQQPQQPPPPPPPPPPPSAAPRSIGAPMSPTQIQRPAPTSAASNGSTFLRNFDWNNSGVHSQFQDMHHLHPNYMFNTSEATNEYNLLNDFLSSSLLDDGGIYNSDDAQALFSDPLLATSSMNALALGLPGQPPGPQHAGLQPPAASSSAPSSSQQQQQQQQQQPQHHQHQQHPPFHAAGGGGHEISRPPSAFPDDSRARDKFYMTAADPAGLASAEDRLHKLLRAKYDAGLLRPFNYVKGYARLDAYLTAHLPRGAQLRIRHQLDRFRPKFREAMQTLTDMQLVVVEMWFENCLMEYDRVFAAMALPACCWRRTGEIYRGNAEMAELLRRPLAALRDGRLAIHDIFAADSLVSYWEKFGAIAFDNTQKAILTSCSLKLPLDGDGDGAADGTNGVARPAAKTENGGGPAGPRAAGNGTASGHGAGEADNKAASRAAKTVRCCFSFTIRRDSHNIPSLIVGNFLPIPDQPS